jgi:hypothetical protein
MSRDTLANQGGGGKGVVKKSESVTFFFERSLIVNGPL